MRRTEIETRLIAALSQLKVEVATGMVKVETLSKWLEMRMLLNCVNASEDLLANSQNGNFSLAAITKAAEGAFCNDMLKMLNPSASENGNPQAGLPRMIP